MEYNLNSDNFRSGAIVTNNAGRRRPEELCAVGIRGTNTLLFQKYDQNVDRWVSSRKIRLLENVRSPHMVTTNEKLYIMSDEAPQVTETIYYFFITI